MRIIAIVLFTLLSYCSIGQTLKYSDYNKYVAVESSANTYTVTLDFTVQNKRTFFIQFPTANTGSATLNGITLKSNGTTLSSGAVGANSIVEVYYDGTNLNLIGSGGSGGGGTWGSISGTLSNQTDLQSALDAKQDVLVSGTNIKTINSGSLLGSGNLAVGDALVANPLSQFASTTSAQLSGVISDETGSGSLVFSTSPVFTTPNIGSATGSISGNAGTATILATARTIGTITGDATSSGSSFDGSANNTNALTLATVNSNVGSFGSATQVGTFTVNGKGLITAASNTTVTPAVGSITGLGTGVATALGINTGTSGSFVVNGGALGTPSSGTLTNVTGLPLTTGVTGVLPVANGGTNASSASITAFNNITGYTASGATGTTSTNLVFSTSPTLVTPTLGVASSTSESITGTGGNGFVQIDNQSSAPSTPTSSGRIYFDNSNRFSWIGTNGFTRTFDGTSNTANRVYTTPDFNGGILVSGGDNQFSGPTTFTGSSTNTWKGVFNSLGVTQTNGAGLWLANNTTSTLGNQQLSPSLVLEGQGFMTNSSVSRSVKIAQDVLPVQGTLNPQANWRVRYSVDGSAYSNLLSVTNDNGAVAGTWTFTGNSYSLTPSSGSSTTLLSTARLLLQSTGTYVDINGNGQATGNTIVFRNQNAFTAGPFNAFAFGGAGSAAAISLVASSSANFTVNYITAIPSITLNDASSTIDFRGYRYGPTGSFGSGTLTMRGFVYDDSGVTYTGTPTIYAFTANRGLNGFGTLTPTYKIQGKGDGTTTGNLFRLEDSAGTGRMTMLDNGTTNFTPDVTTGTGTSAGVRMTFNSLTSGTGISAATTSGTSGYLAHFSSTSTTIDHTAGTSALVGINSTGSNGSSGKLVAGLHVIIGNTGTASINDGIIIDASGASTNRAIVSSSGQWGVNTLTPGASAQMEISSTTKGFLPPRMTGTQAEAISSPAEGLMVYSTDGSGSTITSKGWWGFDGTNWVKLN